MYNEGDDLIGFKYNNEVYYYIKNIQRDIVGILDSNYNSPVTMPQDIWNCESTYKGFDVGIKYNDYYSAETPGDEMFVGFSYEKHIGLGGHIKFGYTFDYQGEKFMKVRVCEKRIFAAIFDFLIIYMFSYHMVKILILLLPKSIITLIICNIFGLLLIMILIVYKDNLFISGSLGKKIFGIGIYDLKTNKYATKDVKIKRNKALINSFEDVFFKIEKYNKRYGDIKYNTKVDNIRR